MMIDLIRPRWWTIAAIAALVLGVVGLYAGWLRWAPVAILAGEIFVILAAITFTTPSTSVSQAAQQAAAQPANSSAPASRNVETVSNAETQAEPEQADESS